MRPLLNCWIVAMWLWAVSRLRAYVWTRRSIHFRGLVPHFGTAHPAGWRRAHVVEYIPPKRDLWTPRNFLVLFSGSYRVWEFRAVRVRRFSSLQAARRWMAREEPIDEQPFRKPV